MRIILLALVGVACVHAQTGETAEKDLPVVMVLVAPAIHGLPSIRGYRAKPEHSSR